MPCFTASEHSLTVAGCFAKRYRVKELWGLGVEEFRKGPDEKHMKYKTLAWGIPLLIVGALVALIVSRPAGTQQDALIWARSTDTTTLDPQEIEWGEDAKVSDNIYESLVTFADEPTQIVPHLATKWDTSPDGKTWTFTLRQGVTFHDGSPFNAETVVFTFQRLTNPKFEHRPTVAPYEGLYSNIQKVEAPSSYQVVFTLKEPSSVFLTTLAMFSAAIVNPETVARTGKAFPAKPNGTGPYRLAEWKRDEKLVLERFDGYWGTRAPIQKVIFLPIKEPQAAIQQLKQGQVHVVDHVTMGDIEPLKSDPNVQVIVSGSMNVCYLGFNLKKPPYNDINFRRAVTLALDRTTLNTLVYYGLAEMPRNLVPPLVWGRTGELPEYEHNLDKAKEALAKVHLPENFRLTLWHPTFARPYMQEPLRVAEFVKDQLRKIGLDVALEGFEKSVYTNKTRDPEHPMYLLGWNADYADPDNFYYPLLHGDMAGDLNGSFFNHTEFNSVVKKAQHELNPDKRAALYRRAAEIYRSELPTFPLVHVPSLIAVSKTVEYRHHPLEIRLTQARFR